MDQPNAAAALRSGSPGKKQTILVCVLLALITAGAYWPVSRLGFINLDDPDYVSGNPRVQAGLTAEGVKWAFTALYASNWHPLTWLSHMLDCQLYHLKPAGHHITSLLLHVANSLLLFGLLKRLTGAFWRSALVAALFALHPLHVESVAWVSERKDVLSAFFFLLTLWTYARYAGKSVARPGTTDHGPRTRDRQSRFRFHVSAFYVLSLLCFMLGLLSKPMLVTVPFILLLLDYWPLGKFGPTTQDPRPRDLLRLTLAKWPFFVLSALSCVVTFLVQRASGAVVPLESGPLESRVANALFSYLAYIEKTLWPARLAVFYPYLQLTLDAWQVVGAGLLLLVLTAGAVLVRKRHPYLLVGWLWFLGMLVPVIGLVQVGKQSMADRYTYLPHIGLFICIVWGGAAVFARLQRPALLASAAAAVAVAACALLTFQQLSYWRNTTTLFEHAAAVTEQNFVAYAVIGNEFADQHELTEAIKQCERALEISPGYPEAHNTLGNVYAQQGNYDEAIVEYRKAAEDTSYADPRNGLANVFIQQGKYAEAEAQAREALRLAPMHLPAMFCLAVALNGQGKLDEAAEWYRRMLALNPNLSTPHRNLGKILVAQGKRDQGIPELSRALELYPADGDTRTVLGITLLARNRTDEAIAQLREAARLQPTNALANYNLGLIYQGRKQPHEAVERFRLALKSQPDWPETLNNLAWILAANPDATVRDGTAAVALAERACKLTDYKAPLLVGTLAAAYAEAGRFAEAVSSAEKARALAQAAGLQVVAQKNEELLALYRAGQAYHESQ